KLPGYRAVGDADAPHTAAQRRHHSAVRNPGGRRAGAGFAALVRQRRKRARVAPSPATTASAVSTNGSRRSKGAARLTPTPAGSGQRSRTIDDVDLRIAGRKRLAGSISLHHGL